MLDVQRYAYINARLRTRLGYLLDKELIQKMLQSPSIDESLFYLKGTNYEIFYDNYQNTGDLTSAEQALSQSQLKFFSQLGAGLSLEVRKLMRALLLMHEVRFLKTVLRLWFHNEIIRKGVTPITIYSASMRIAHEIAYDALLVCTSLKEIAHCLSHTPYASIIELKENQVLADRSIYALEVAFDRLAYEHIYKSILLLPAFESVVAKRLFGPYIDLENIQFGKSLILHGADKNLVLANEFLAGGINLTKNQWLELLYDDQMLRHTIQSWYPSLDTSEHILLSELLYSAQINFLYASGRRALTSYPFSCASIMAYFFLIEHDINTITTITNGKAYGLSSTEIIRNLNH